MANQDNDKIFFFCETGFLAASQPANKAFAYTKLDNPSLPTKTEFLTTSILNTTSVSKAIAVVNGTICIQKESANPNTYVNIILKPRTSFQIKGLYVNYIIYKRISSTSLFNIINNIYELLPKPNLPHKNILDHIHEQNNKRNKEYDRSKGNQSGTTTTPPFNKDLGLEFTNNASGNSQVLDSDSLDKLFFNYEANINLYEVKAGMILGNFHSELGIEVILRNDINRLIPVEVSRKFENYLSCEISTTITEYDKLKMLYNTSICNSFIDIITLYSIKVEKLYEIKINLEQHQTKKIKNIDFYQNISPKFYNANTIFIDIRNEKFQPFNFYRNYSDNIEVSLENSATPLLGTFTNKNILENHWPLIKIRNSDFSSSSTEETRRLHLKLNLGITDENPQPFIYIDIEVPCPETKRSKEFINIIRGVNNNLSQIISFNLLNPKCSASPIEYRISAGLIKLVLGRRTVPFTIDPSMSKFTFREENYLDCKFILMPDNNPLARTNYTYFFNNNKILLDDSPLFSNPSIAETPKLYDSKDSIFTLALITKNSLDNYPENSKTLETLSKQYSIQDKKSFINILNEYDTLIKTRNIVIEITTSGVKKTYSLNEYFYDRTPTPSSEPKVFLNGITQLEFSKTELDNLIGIAKSTTVMPFVIGTDPPYTANFNLNLPIYITFTNQVVTEDDNSVKIRTYEIGVIGHDIITGEAHRLQYVGVKKVLKIAFDQIGSLSDCNPDILDQSSYTENYLQNIISQWSGLRGNILFDYVNVRGGNWNLTSNTPLALKASFASCLATAIIAGELLTEPNPPIYTLLENKAIEVLTPGYVVKTEYSIGNFENRVREMVNIVFHPNLNSTEGKEFNKLDNTKNDKLNNRLNRVKLICDKSDINVQAWTNSSDFDDTSCKGLGLNPSTKDTLMVNFVNECYGVIIQEIEKKYRQILGCLTSSNIDNTMNLKVIACGDGTHTTGLFGQADLAGATTVQKNKARSIGISVFPYIVYMDNNLKVREYNSAEIDLNPNIFNSLNLNIFGVDKEDKLNFLVIIVGLVSYCLIIEKRQTRAGSGIYNYIIRPHNYNEFNPTDPFNQIEITKNELLGKITFPFSLNPRNTNVIDWLNGATFDKTTFTINFPESNLTRAKVLLRSSNVGVHNGTVFYEELFLPILNIPGIPPPTIELKIKSIDNYKPNKFKTNMTGLDNYAVLFNFTCLIGALDPHQSQTEYVKLFLRLMLTYNPSVSNKLFGNAVGKFSIDNDLYSEVIPANKLIESEEVSGYSDDKSSTMYNNHLNMKNRRTSIFNLPISDITNGAVLNLTIDSYTDPVNATLETKEFKPNKMAQFVFKRFRVKKEITSYDGTTIVNISEADIFYSQNTVLSALRCMDLGYNFYEYLILFLENERGQASNGRTFSTANIDSLLTKLRSAQNALKVYVGKTNTSTEPDSNFRVLDVESYKLMLRNE